MWNVGSVNAEGFDPFTSLLLFSAVIIGGIGSPLGAVVGMLYFKIIQYYLPEWAQFFSTSFGVLIILLFVPGGLATIVFRIRDSALSRFAAARGIRIAGDESLRREHEQSGAAVIHTAADHAAEQPQGASS
jgi:hypothetical protein